MGARRMKGSGMIAVRASEAPDLAPRPVDLDGQRLGVLDTGAEDNARFLHQLTARLEKRHFLAAIVRVTKPSEHQPCPAEVLDRLAEQCDVVVTGACRSAEDARASAADAAAFERRSVPCAVVVATGTSALADVPALVEASFRDVERVLTGGPGRSQPPQARAEPGGNGEVSCEC